MSNDTRMKSNAVLAARADSQSRMETERATVTEQLAILNQSHGALVLASFDNPDDVEAMLSVAESNSKITSAEKRLAEINLAMAALKDREERIAREGQRAQIEKRLSRWENEAGPAAVKLAKRLEKCIAEFCDLQKEARQLAEKTIIAMPTPLPPGAAAWFSWQEAQVRIANELAQHSENFVGGSPMAKAPFVPVGAKRFMGTGNEVARSLVDRIQDDVDFITNFARSNLDRGSPVGIPRAVATPPTGSAAAKSTILAESGSPGQQPTRTAAEIQATIPKTRILIDTRKGSK